jgi:hypothetical protein
LAGGDDGGGGTVEVDAPAVGAAAGTAQGVGVVVNKEPGEPVQHMWLWVSRDHTDARDAAVLKVT